jgi:hypothetical protein
VTEIQCPRCLGKVDLSYIEIEAENLKGLERGVDYQVCPGFEGRPCGRLIQLKAACSTLKPSSALHAKT